MKEKFTFSEKNLLLASILVFVIFCVVAIVYLSSGVLSSGVSKEKQIAQVSEFYCAPNSNVILQNGNFEQLTQNALGHLYRLSAPQFFEEPHDEVCFFEGASIPVVFDQVSFDPSSNNLLSLHYARHTGQGNPTSPWFNGHQSIGAAQYLGEIPPGEYQISLKAKTEGPAPLSLFIGFSQGPILRNSISTSNCTLSSNTFFPDTTAQDTRFDQFETCVLNQFEAYGEIGGIIPSSEGGVQNTYSQTITITEEGLDHIYFLPFGSDTGWTVPSGWSLAKPVGKLIVDDIVIVNPKFRNICNPLYQAVASSSQSYGPMFYNQNGQVTSWGLGNFIGLSQIDSEPLTWVEYQSLSSATGGQGLVFQRPSQGTFVVTPLSPYANYTLQDIQQMFSFMNVSIAGINTVYDNNGPFVSSDKKNIFARLFMKNVALANIAVPHYLVSYVCSDGLQSNPIPQRQIPIDISIIKKFLDNTLSSTDRQIKYLVTIQNNSLTSGATSLFVNDLLPSGIIYSSHTIEGSVGSSYNPQTGSITIPFLGASSSVNLVIVANVPTNTCGLRTNTASLQSFDQYDPNPANNISSVSLNLTCITTKTGLTNVNKK